jgi:hypothetical protein
MIARIAIGIGLNGWRRDGSGRAAGNAMLLEPVIGHAQRFQDLHTPPTTARCGRQIRACPSLKSSDKVPHAADAPPRTLQSVSPRPPAVVSLNVQMNVSRAQTSLAPLDKLHRLGSPPMQPAYPKCTGFAALGLTVAEVSIAPTLGSRCRDPEFLFLIF